MSVAGVVAEVLLAQASQHDDSGRLKGTGVILVVTKGIAGDIPQT